MADTASTLNFHCHKCRKAVFVADPDGAFECPICHESFLEDISTAPAAPQAAPAAAATPQPAAASATATVNVNPFMSFQWLFGPPGAAAATPASSSAASASAPGTRSSGSSGAAPTTNPFQVPQPNALMHIFQNLMAQSQAAAQHQQHMAAHHAAHQAAHARATGGTAPTAPPPMAQAAPVLGDMLNQMMFQMFGGGGMFGFPAGGGGVAADPRNYAPNEVSLERILQQLLEQSGEGGPAPASQEVIDSLPTVQVDSSQSSEPCAVCRDTFEDQAEARRLPCDHLFHPDCIVPWLQLHATCPICRQSVDPARQ